MTRTERLAVAIVAALIALFVAAVALGIADALGALPWFSNGSNLIQWISGPGTFAAVAVGVTAYLNRTCAASRICFRLGEHPVEGTLKKVCAHHHTLEHHQAVHARHGLAHRLSGRLDRGESHQGGRPH